MGIITKIKNKIFNRRYRYVSTRLESSTQEIKDPALIRVMNLLNYTKTSEVSYSAGAFDSGYHSFDLNGHKFKGQRDPRLRFRDLPISLEGLSVLDIGCNQGGMLHAFADQIKYGVGVDYDSRMINAANKIKSYTNHHNLDFFVFNLEQENLDYLYDFIKEDKVDVVLLLSVCMWIKNWREVIDFSSQISDKMIFESNGKAEQQEEQINYLKQVYTSVEIVNETSEDDPSQKMRKLLYCS